MAAEQCWLSLAVVLACRAFIFFVFFFPPFISGVWWKGFKQIPFNLKVFPALFLSACCFQACSLWTAATISHKGGSLSLGMGDPTWKTPGEELACGVKCISSRWNTKCISSRWNNPLTRSWKCLPGGNFERGTVRKMGFLLSLAWFRILDSLKLCTCFSGRSWFEEKQTNPFWTDGAAKKGGREVAWKQMEEGVWKEDGEREYVWYRLKQVCEEWCKPAPEVSQGARGTWKSCQQEETCVSAQGLSFPFSGTNESRQVAATSWTHSQALFWSFSPHPELPLFGATTQTSSQTPLESGNLGTIHPIPFLPPYDPAYGLTNWVIF